VNSIAAVIPIGNPTASALSERRATSRRRSTIATQSPASGPNSGPTTIAPTIRIGEPRKRPDRGDQAGEHHEGDEAAAQLDVLGGAGLDLLPDDGVGGHPAGGVLRPLRRVGDLGVDLLERDRPVAGDAELFQVVDDDAGVLAGDVAEDHVAGRLARRPRQVNEVAGRRRRLEQVDGLSGPVAGGDDPQVDHPGSVPVAMVAEAVI